jgi:Ca2+-binding RTX toxin-like protein
VLTAHRSPSSFAPLMAVKPGIFGRRLALASLVALSFAAVMLARTPVAAAQESLAASCESMLNTYDGATGDRLFAQPFSSPLSGNLTRAEIELRDLSGAGDWIVEIRAAQPSAIYTGELEPTAAVLATATVSDATNVPEGHDARVSVVFTTPAAVVAGGGYAISITRPASLGANDLAVGAHTPETTECPHRGYSSINGGTTWGGLGTDLIFRVFVSPPPSAVTPPSVTPPPTGAPPASCKGQQATRVGTGGNDHLTGTAGRDVIATLGGNDKVVGLAGDDLICGGPGKDKLNGGAGKDILLGEGGKDKLNGGKTDDVCKGGKGEDSAANCEVEKSI